MVILSVVWRALSHRQHPAALRINFGVWVLAPWWMLVVSHRLLLFSWRALAGVILFVFRLDALVVRLEGIAMCGYCGVYALCRSVCL